MSVPTIVWFRQDLRLADQAALAAAAAEGPVVPVYVLDDESAGPWAVGGAQRWWLDGSLRALAGALDDLGSRLVLRRGCVTRVLPELARELGTRRIHAVRHYEPWWRRAEDALAGELDLVLHDGNQLRPPRAVRSGSAGAFRIYGAFWRAFGQLGPLPAPEPAPERIAPPTHWPASERLDDWGLKPTAPDWAARFGEDWRPGLDGAGERLAELAQRLERYAETRNLPGVEGTSRLSPHLHHGEVSPASVWRCLSDLPEPEKILKELAWRDFATGVIDSDPSYGERPSRPAFARMAWRTGADADAEFRAWTRGLTGYPIVDAGMRQLWKTGWMHNRVRMIVASFLVKHLLIDWRLGARWFWDTLIDADYANNSVNWQWVAGSGADAQMFGRIMAPLAQSAKFDAADYIRRWVPELSALNDLQIHDPAGAGVAPSDYPRPIIGHKEGRERALAAGRAMRNA